MIKAHLLGISAGILWGMLLQRLLYMRIDWLCIFMVSSAVLTSVQVFAESRTQRMSSSLVSMPRELTAENGAKALFIGEFSETVPNPYHCDCDLGPEDCEACYLTEDNWIPKTLTHQISWTTIKAIYRHAVKHLHVK